MPGGRVGHAHGRLAVQALLVERALAGDHQVGAGEVVVDARELQHQLDALPEGAAEQVGGVTGAAGRPRARLAGDVAPGRLAHQPGEPAERRVEPRDVGLGRALLRAVDGGRAVLAGQRVVHVAGEHQVDVAHPLQGGVEVDGRDLVETGAAERDLGAGGVEQPRAERGEDPRPGVGAGAAAQAEDDRAAARLDRRVDRLTGAERRGGQRLEPAAGEQLETTGGGELDDRGALAYGDRGVDRLAGRAAHPHRHPLEAGGQRRLERAVAAVGDGHPDDLDVRTPVAQPAGQVLGSLG